MRLRPRSLTASSLLLLGASALALGAGCSSASPGTGAPDYGGVAGSSGGGPSGSSSGSTGGSSGGSSGGGSGGSGGGSSSGVSSSSSGSSGGSSSGGVDAGSMTIGSGTWADGQAITSSVTIGAGATVTIDPAATVNVATGVTITVLGTLTASSATTHAKLTGTSWAGIVVGSGGTLQLDGVDLVSPTTAIDVRMGAVAAEYDDGTISAATSPFDIEAGGMLTTKHATVTGTLGSSSVAGSLTTSYLDYDSNGHAGITTTAPAAQLSVEDSTLHGSGPVADFLVSAGGAAKFHVAYTNISNVHCGFHFDTVSEFDVSHSNIDGNAWGFMLYGSGGAGPFTVTYSNMYSNTSYDYEVQGTNSPITIDHDYSAGTTSPGNAVTVTNAQTAMVTGTGPR